jgi:hypothetical protein
LRRFILTEHQRIEFRADVTNLLNHAQFNVTSPGSLMVATTIFGTTAGVTSGSRRIQLVLRYSF